MADNLRLRIVLDMAERVLAPMRRISASSTAAGAALKAAREKLKELNTQQKQVGEFRQLKQGLQETSAKLAEAQNKVASLARAHRAAGPPTRAMTREMEAAKRAAAELGQQHTTQQAQLQRLRDRLTAAGINTRELGQHERRLRADMAAANAAIERQTARLRANAEQQRRLTQLTQAHGGAMMKTAMVGGAGAAMMFAGKKGVETGMGPVRDYSKHEDAMLGIARQVPGARNEMGQLTEVYRQAERDVRALSGQIPLVTTEIAAMMTAAARMEVPTDKLKEFTLMASEIATAFDAVPDEITESMGKVAKNFKIPLTDIRGLADSINYLDDNAISKGADIIDFLNRTSGVVSTVAMSAQDAAALGSTLLTLGERAETASTAANAIVQKFAAATKGTKNFKSAMAELGLSTETVQTGMSTDATATLEKVISAIGKLPESKRIGVMVELVGMEHSDTLAKLVDKPEELDRQRKLSNSGEAKGSMAREAAARNATLSAQWQMTKNRAFNLSAVAGESLAPAVLSLLNAVNPLIESFGRWVQDHPALVGWVLKLVIGGAALVAALGALTLALALIVGKALLVRFAFKWMALAMFGAGGGAAGAGLGMRLLTWALTLLRTGAMMAGRAILFIGRALLMNPIGLLITAIAVAAFLIYKYWAPIKAFFSGLWNDIKAGAAAVWQDLGGSIPAVLATIGAAIVNWSPLGLFYRAFAGVMGWFGVELPAKFSTFGANLISGLVGGITSGLGWLKDTVVGVASSVAGWFKEKLGINSPSRVFMEFGGWVSEGAALGIAGGAGAVRTAALGMATAATMAMPMATAATMAMPMAADAAALRLDTRAPLATAAPGAGMAGMGGTTIHITINAAPDMDAQAIARAVAAEIDRRQREQRTRRLSSLHDMD